MEENEKIEEGNKNIVEQRKEKIKKLFKKNNIIYYIILLIITWIAVYIRTLNIDKLKDITTNSWTLGPDLDPFLFLRWAEYIVAHGKLFVMDSMRYVPLGYDTSGEMKLLSYMVAWFHNILIKLPDFITTKLPGSPSEITVTYSAILFPVVLFAFTCIVFFLLVRKIFYESFENKNIPNIIALISTFFLAVIPSLLPRTIAGIPEKESAGFLFIFLSFYFIICSFKSKKYTWLIINGLLAGIFTSILGLVWGGVTFVFMTIGVSVFVYYILGYINKKLLAGYISWIIAFMIITMSFSSRYTLLGYLISTSTMTVFATLFFILFNIYVFPLIKDINIIKLNKEKYHISSEIFSLIIIGIILLIGILIYFGPGFITNQINEIQEHLIHPLGTNRFSVTVAENRQPYFIDEWKGNFGPLFYDIPLFFWLFIIGSILLFYNMLKNLHKKDRLLLTISYLIFILCLIFSRYSPDNQLNGVSNVSIFIYFGGMILFGASLIYIFYKYLKNNQIELMKIDFGQILIFMLFFISIVAARGAVRLVMMLAPSISIMVSYLIVISIKKARNSKKDDIEKIGYLIVAGIIVISSIYSGYIFYEISKAQAESFYPSGYSYQWQRAMSWVREKTPENAVFAHWWDYGYWLQSIGKRATVLDGGNAITYWDHLMGRYVLTTPDDKTAFQFLYTHNATHLLIDSTDIGKYSAFSSIGADKNYDRYSYIPTFFMEQKATIELQNSTKYLYKGGVGLDEDVIYENNGSKIFLTAENSGIGGIIIEKSSSGKLIQPLAVFIQQGKQIEIPMKYLYYNKTLQKFNSGIDAGVFIIQTVNPTKDGRNIEVNNNGALFYLSKRTVNSLLVRKYLFNEEKGFKLLHNEPSIIIAQIRAQGGNIDDFIYFQGSFLGPIKIWGVEYPKNVEFNKSYLERNTPPDLGVEL